MKRAFTLIELLVSIGIFAIISATGLVVYTQTIGKSDLRGEAALLSQTLHQAQWQAIAEKSADGANPSAFGVHLEENSYVLFSGTSYSQTAPDNLVTNLPDNIGLTYNLPSADLVFDAATGLFSALGEDSEFWQAGYDYPGQITLTDTNDQSKILTINELGVVDID